MIAEKVYVPGVSGSIKDFLPLNEAAISRYMKHEHVVETYWADVRCLDPESLRPLDIGANELVMAGTWTALEGLDGLEATVTEAAESRRALPGGESAPHVKLQMRIAMEYCNLGPLRKYLVDPNRRMPRPLSMLVSARRGKVMSAPVCAILTALDIAEALKFMHKGQTLHADLKPQNILLKSDDKEDKGFSAKLCDFGVSAHMRREQHSVGISVGTEAYLAPEVFQKMEVTEATDIYALGLLIWEIWYGIFWWSIYDAEQKKRGSRSALEMAGFRPRCNAKAPPAFAALVHDCLSDDSDARPSAKEVVSRLIGIVDEQYQTEAEAVIDSPKSVVSTPR